jgi:dienelactone hydrolase
MPFHRTCLILLPTLLAAVAPAAAQSQAAAGRWRGYYDVIAFSYTRVVILDLRTDGTASVQTAAEDTAPTPVRVARSGDSVRIVVPFGADSVVLRGAYGDSVMMGTASWGNSPGRFAFRREPELSVAELRSVVGDYRLADGSLLSVTGGGSTYAGVGFLLWRSGRLGQLWPTGPARFVAGPARLVPSPVALSIEVAPGGELRLREGGGPVETARRIEVGREREVRISSGAAELAATLTLPAEGRAPYPAVVLLTGSGANPRFRGGIVTFFASRGFAVLTWDKRGAGASTGDFVTADFDTLAADALAAIRFLRAQPEVAPDRVGLWGISQGGWVAALVAARDPRLAFAVLHAGPSVTPADQGADELRSRMAEQNASPEDTETALAYQRLYNAVLTGARPRAELDSTYQSLRARGFRYAWTPAVAETPAGRWYSGVVNFDPKPFWTDSRVPVLAFFGENDALVPPESNLEGFRAAFAGDPSRLEVVILPRANHRFEIAERRTNRDFPTTGQYVPGYWPRMAEWLRRFGGR